MGAVDPTAHGRKVIIAKFGKAAFGASVAIVDATPKRKSRRR
jgi:hypothetical protein